MYMFFVLIFIKDILDGITNLRSHTRYIKNKDPKSAYALHILDNKHEYGPIQDNMHLLKPCSKGRSMTTMENFYIQIFHKQGILIDEQCVTENPLFQLIDLHHRPTLFDFTCSLSQVDQPANNNEELLLLLQRISRHKIMETCCCCWNKYNSNSKSNNKNTCNSCNKFTRHC